MPVSAFFASTLAKNDTALKPFAATQRAYYAQGRGPEAGDVLVQADLARTLQSIADGGAAAFYRGDFAEALDRHARETGAFLRKEDLASYAGEWREPLRARYRGYELIGQPPVSVGIAVLEAMQILEEFDLKDLADASFELIHLQIEAMKIAMADVRAHISDPAFVGERAVPELLDRGHAARRAKEIDAQRAGSFTGADLFAQAGTDTSYAAAIDADGNVVSLLQSVYHVFGCGEVVPTTGVLMNNRMTGFSLDPVSPNVLAPGKRTLHTLNPLLALAPDGNVMALGTPGGPSQVYTNVSLLVRTIDHALDLQRAVDAPRWFVTPGHDLNIETSVSAEVRDRLGSSGHKVVGFAPHSAAMGGAGMARINARGVREAAADPRRESYALAY
jgi:gamma-glutamyltranspeptidase/glutathione hydrolase